MDYYLKHKKPVIAETILLAAILFFIYFFCSPVSVTAFYVKQQDYVPALLLSGTAELALKQNVPKARFTLSLAHIV